MNRPETLQYPNPEITITKHLEKEDIDIYATIIIDDCVIISIKDFDTQFTIIADEVLLQHFSDSNEFRFYDLTDNIAYYRNYAKKFPDRREIVTMIDSILTSLGIELYDDDDNEPINQPLYFPAVEINTIMDMLYYAVKQTRDSAGEIQAFCCDCEVDFTPEENLAMADEAESIANKLSTWFENGGFDVTMTECK